MIRLGRLVSLFLALMFLSQTAVADRIVLKNGDQHSGQVANREDVRRDPFNHVRIAILVAGSSELQRFEADQIDYLVLEDEGTQIVIDLSSPPPVREVPNLTRTSIGGIDDSGGPLIVGGLLLGTVGLLVKFGDEKATITNDSMNYDEKSYNALNYILMGAGGLMVFVGVSMEFGGGWAEATPESGPMLAFALSDGAPGARVGYRLAF